MSSALRFNGSNSLKITFGGSNATINNLHTKSGSTGFEYEFKVAATSIFSILGNQYNYGGYFIVNADKVQFRMGATSGTTVTINCTPNLNGEPHIYLVQRAGNAYSVYEDGLLIGSTTSSATPDGTIIDRIGQYQSVKTTAMDLYYIIFRESIGGTALYNWSAEDSDHSPGTVILSDITGAYHAEGLSFATDGSAWVDLGGGEPTPTVHTADVEKNTIAIAADSFSGEQLVQADLATNNIAITIDNVSAHQTVTATYSKNSIAIALDSINGFQHVTASGLKNNVSIVMDNFTIDDGTTIHTATFEKNSVSIAIDDLSATQSVIANANKNNVAISAGAINAYQSVTVDAEKATVAITIDSFTAYQTTYASFVKNSISTAIDNFTGFQSVTANLLPNIVNIVIDNVIIYSEELANLDLKRVMFSIVNDGYSFVTTGDNYTFETTEETYEVS